MYCNNCGKFIGDGAKLCDECLKLQEDTRIVYSKEEIDKMYAEVEEENKVPSLSLKAPIAATVLSILSLIFECVAMMISSLALIEHMVWPVIAVAVLGLVPGAIGFSKGIITLRASIKGFKSHAGKRVPSMILSIFAILFGIAALVVCGVAVILAVYNSLLFGPLIRDHIADK